MIYPDGTERITPDLSYIPMTAHPSYVNSCTGLNLNAPELVVLLEKMTLIAKEDPSDFDTVSVEIPPTRPDIMHECDIMEDAAIAYGFNNLPDTFPPTSTVAQPLELSKLSDIIRREWALAGFVEVLPLILVRISSYPRPASLNITRLAVFTRGELRVPQPQRHRRHRRAHREPEDARVPGRAHVAAAGPAQDDPREPLAPAAGQGLRDVGRRVQGHDARAPGAQRATRRRGVVQQDGGLRGRAWHARPRDADARGALHLGLGQEGADRVLY